MKCANCNSDLPEGATICPACGAPVKATVPDATPVDLDTELPPPSPEYQPDPDVPPYQPPAEPVTKVEIVTGPVNTTGTNNSSLGTISLVLGIIGILFSCLGCGGILSIAGAITGYLSLKTTSRQTGTIGLIISGLGIIATLVFVCIYLFAFLSSVMSGNRNLNSY